MVAVRIHLEAVTKVLEGLPLEDHPPRSLPRLDRVVDNGVYRCRSWRGHHIVGDIILATRPKPMLMLPCLAFCGFHTHSCITRVVSPMPELVKVSYALFERLLANNIGTVKLQVKRASG
jgi:hypothetical protein